MQQAHVLQRVFYRLFPKKDFDENALDWDKLDPNKKKELAEQYLLQGENYLLKGDLLALKLFQAACDLDPENVSVRYRQGLALFEYGTAQGKEKALLLANKHFKVATKLKNDFAQAWHAWGNVLFSLGKFQGESHYYLEAKEKLQKAISLSEKWEKPDLAHLYWDNGLVWTNIAQNSGEAVDVRMAVQSFRSAYSYHNLDSAEFWNDFGNAYLQMALLVNETRLFFQSIEYFRKSVKKEPTLGEGYSSLAIAFSQLYINTMDESHYARAHDAFAKAVKFNEKDYCLRLEWAQLLGESGRLNKDVKKLNLCIEKCVHANELEPHQPEVIAQWVESLSMVGALTGRLDYIIDAENKILKATDVYPNESDLWLAFGICMQAFGKYYDDPDFYDLAIEKLQEGLSIDKGCAELWHAFANAHYELGKMTEDVDLLETASRFYRKAEDLKPSCPSLIFNSSLNLLLLGDLSARQDILENAVFSFEMLLKDQKDVLLHHPEWLYYYACALDLMGNCTEKDNYYVRAIEVFFNVLLIDPDYPKIHFKIGVAFSHLAELTMEKEFFNRAVNYFRLAMKQDEEDENLWLEWGLTLINLAHQTYDSIPSDDTFLEAEQKLIRAGQLGNQQAYYHLACLCSLLGRYNDSMNLLEKAQDANLLPTLEELVDDEWLEGLRSTESFSRFLSHLEAKQEES